MTIRQALARGATSLHASTSPALDAEVLLAFVLKKPREFLYIHPEFKISRVQESKFRSLVHKRLRRWPVAYLSGYKEFFGMDFLVTPDVLVPRPETELLVELVIQALGEGPSAARDIIDIGTGSGAVIIALAKTARGKLNFFATDISQKALRVARCNARAHRVADKIKFLRGNLLSAVPASRSSVIVANLPYLTEKQYRANPDLDHEPKGALVGQRDGMKYFRELFVQLKTLDYHVEIFLEHDPAQKNKLKRLILRSFPGTEIKFHKDLSGRWRACNFNI